MRQIQQDQATAARRRVYFDVRQLDGISPATGEAGNQPQISVDGAAWTNTGIGTLTHIGNGRYYAELTEAIIGTAGQWIETRYKGAATIETPGTSVEVVGHDTASDLTLITQALTGKIEYDYVNRTVTIYAADGSTALKTLTIESIADGVRES